MRARAGRAQAMNQEHSSAATSSLRLARKGGVAVVGLSVVGLGVALTVLPAPSSIVILLGLAILATEFLWARKPLLWTRTLLGRLRARIGNMLSRRSRSAGRKVQR
jgi:uncharacterized protein (TIGR02611 family)